MRPCRRRAQHGGMKRLTRRIATSGLLAAILTLLASGAAEARISVNHNEN
jgi:hypothetical protein